MHKLAKLDHRYIWHPFTQMKDWLKGEPIVIKQASGAILEDVRGRKYLDANSSIWTNLHGHNHPVLNRAIARQLKRVAHTSALGLANEPASLLAEKLVGAAAPNTLKKVFYSDNGSTAMEVALKQSYEYSRRIKKQTKPRFLSLSGAYHGDTVGAVSLGHIDLFHKTYGGLLFKTDTAKAPYCYRCPHNRAKPERADARLQRKCNFECLDAVQSKLERRKKEREPYAAFVAEPIMQGAAGMIAQPPGWLKQAVGLAKAYGSQFIADEVMTGFGRVNNFPLQPADTRKLFAFQHEDASPDFLALAKGMTGGYLPMAATLTTEDVFDAFLGEYAEFKTFFHGHSYTANQLGSAAALANLELLSNREGIRNRARLQGWLRDHLEGLWKLPNVGDIRQTGLVAGIELVKDWRTRETFPLTARAGMKVCEAMARRGVLTRPIGNVIVLMPPYCSTEAQLGRMVSVLAESIGVLKTS